MEVVFVSAYLFPPLPISSADDFDTRLSIVTLFVYFQHDDLLV